MKVNFKIDGCLRLREEVVGEVKEAIERKGKENTEKFFSEIIKEIISNELTENEFMLNESTINCTADFIE